MRRTWRSICWTFSNASRCYGGWRPRDRLSSKVVQHLKQEHPMSEAFDPRKSATAFDQASTLVAVLELSGKSWQAGAIVPGVSRRPSRQLEAYVMHPASLPVERRGRRAKTDRIDVDILLRALLGWLRGEPRHCTMAPIPSEAEEDMREPGRQRETLTAARLKVENQMRSLLARFGVAHFRPRLKKAAEHLDKLRAFDGRPLPANTKASLERLLAQHRLLSEQLREIEAARERVVAVADPDRFERMI